MASSAQRTQGAPGAPWAGCRIVNFLAAQYNGGTRSRAPPSLAAFTQDDAMTDYTVARLNMVESQIRPSDVHDTRLIAAMADVPRERFVPPSMAGIAYMDEDLLLTEPGGGGAARYLMEPRVFAKLVQLCEIDPSDVVLDVGCATGYSAAVLARLASAVVALESDQDLAALADTALTELGADNAAGVAGPLEQGYPSQGPYDVIFFNGSVPAVPQAIKEQLKDGGRLVAVETEDGVGRARLYVRSDGTVTGRTAFDAAVNPLPGFEVAEAFTF